MQGRSPLLRRLLLRRHSSCPRCPSCPQCPRCHRCLPCRCPRCRPLMQPLSQRSRRLSSSRRAILAWTRSPSRSPLASCQPPSWASTCSSTPLVAQRKPSSQSSRSPLEHQLVLVPEAWGALLRPRQRSVTRRPSFSRASPTSRKSRSDGSTRIRSQLSPRQSRQRRRQLGSQHGL